MGLATNNVYQGDCIRGLQQIKPGSVDLAFADPPFNIGYDYDVYHDQRADGEYLDWTKNWMLGVRKALKADGAFWLAIGDEYAAELKLIAQRDLGFTCRSWILWYYTFGVNCTRAFSRSHTHLLYFVAHPKKFTFNSDDPAVRVPSARQLVYADARANPKGRLPDNTWILRPQDLPNGFTPDEDTWYFPRVAGTFKEREGFHGCQMPEQLLGRIIRCCSNPAETVLDPFGGSGTTFTVAKKLGRKWIGFELSEDYVDRIKSRLEKTAVGGALDGAADPLSSAPSTHERMNRQTRTRTKIRIRKHTEEVTKERTKEPTNAPTKEPTNASTDGRTNGQAAKPLRVPARQKETPSRAKERPVGESARFLQGIIDAYVATHDGLSCDYLLADTELNQAFLDVCKKSGLAGEPRDWNSALLRVRKTGKLPRSKAEARKRRITSVEMDWYGFASEVALQQLSVECNTTLDGILSDPGLAERFDELARSFSPGYSSFQYRWAALALRKRAKTAKRLALETYHDWLHRKLPRRKKISECDWSRYKCPGVYLLSNPSGQWLHVGETVDLERRIDLISRIPAWKRLKPVEATLICEKNKLIGLQATLVQRVRPVMNSHLLLPEDEAGWE